MANAPVLALGNASPAIATANPALVAVGIHLQSYCVAVKEQTTVSFAGFERLAAYESEVNRGLAAAKAHADAYLNTIEPAIRVNVANIGNYFDVHSAVLTILPPGSTKKEWLDSIAGVKEAVDEYKHQADGIVALLIPLRDGLVTDVGSFAKTVSQLNAAVNGDNGVLDGLDKEISDIQGKIGGTIAGLAISGLAIAGGLVMILVGALAEVVTGGAATALVVGGAVVLIAGVGGAIGAGVALAGLVNAKADLITRKSSLTSEVQFALGMKTGFADLRDQAGVAVQGAMAMQSAWEFLSNDLSNLSSDLNKGIIATDKVRELWLTAANSVNKKVADDIVTIKQQMSGTTIKIAPKGTTIGTYVTDVVHDLAA
jgi:non-hemolytic enterotoxin B/C